MYKDDIFNLKEYLDEKKSKFINSEDRFKNTPLLCACFKQKEETQDFKRKDLV